MGLRRYKIAIFICVIIATFASEANTSNGIAGEAVTQLKTASGLLIVRKAMGPDCGRGPEATLAETCTALYLNDKVILAEQSVDIDKTFPTAQDAKLINIYTNTGGNHCCDYRYIIDITTTPPLKLEGYSFDNIWGSKSRVQFKMTDGTNALGDPLIRTFSYELGSGKPVKIREEPEYNSSQITDKSTVPDILANPVMREPLLKIIGESNFREFRNSMGLWGPGAVLQEPLKIVDGNIVVGSGECHWGKCYGHYAMFVLDITNNLAWAVEGEGDADEQPKAKLWGLLTPDDAVQLREIRSWLAQHHVPERSVSFVSLPDRVAKLYKRPRKTVAKTETPQPALQSAAQVATDKAEQNPPPSPALEAIPLQQEGKTFVVPVSINGALTLKFTVDSGAADVAIPADVVMTLLRTGTLSPGDFLGKKMYRLADGSIVPSQTFHIRSLKVGDRVVENVTGSISSASGILLLGQSFLSRLKSWSIDNSRQVMLIE